MVLGDELSWYQDINSSGCQVSKLLGTELCRGIGAQFHRGVGLNDRALAGVSLDVFVYIIVSPMVIILSLLLWY